MFDKRAAVVKSTNPMVPTPRQAEHANGVAPELTIDVLRWGTVAVLGLSGRLSGPGSRQLMDTLDWLVSAGAREITLHLDGTETPDAAFLRLLRDTRNRLIRSGGELVASSPQPESQAVLDMVGLTDASVGHLSP